eukprot:CAMPEP_0181179090 /NCGR_PEP_ID=MMETSP1096-20121128/6074_1 /TAXON_ID=156174 ORGANISM="Chrysochromulina ericina, Strain CCMP281" /NCGR_SAMPLE_ID=MMETSP1096 /ASSEMBLY_ACC=CAM_ASM_000453 /LENGTH=106 /DNA_ID=CAMNT_0023267415 /DNA_START=368 /DNA_END=684 /DNA_ORIENTATION=-
MRLIRATLDGQVQRAPVLQKTSELAHDLWHRGTEGRLLVPARLQQWLIRPKMGSQLNARSVAITDFHENEHVRVLCEGDCAVQDFPHEQAEAVDIARLVKWLEQHL